MPRETPINALSYNGPIDQPAYKQACDVHTFVMCNSGQLTSSGAGVIATVFDSQAQLSACADDARFQLAFREFRLLAMKVKYIPWNKYSKPTTTVTAPVYIVVDRTTATALTSVADALGSATVIQRSFEDGWTKAVRMDSPEEAQWIACGSSPAAAARLYIKLYASGLSNSIIYGDFITTIVVQYRCL